MLSVKIPFSKENSLKENLDEDITGKLFKIAVKELGLNQTP